jgi:hypothetical protein
MSAADHKAAFERWLSYERECCLANTAHLTIEPLPEPNPHWQTVTLPRKLVLDHRASYLLLRNAVADLLGLDPETMTQREVIVAVYKKKWNDAEAEKETQ